MWQRCGILCGRYQYIEDLIALESRGMTTPSNTFSFSMSHPLNSGCWEPFLVIHPDQQFAGYLRRHLSHGFHIGFQRDTRLNGIDPSLCSLKYASVDEAVEVIRRWGPGTLLAKLDLKAAYRMPSSKLSRLQQLLNEWLSRQSSTKRQLQSLLGYLNDSCEAR